MLAAYAGVCTLIGHRAAPIFEAVRRAADPASDVRELWTTVLRNRRAGARMVIDRLLALGPLGPPLDRAIDMLWIFNDPAHYDALVRHCGWPEPEYRGWLAGQMNHALLPA